MPRFQPNSTQLREKRKRRRRRQEILSLSNPHLTLSLSSTGAQLHLLSFVDLLNLATSSSIRRLMISANRQ